MYSVWEKNSFSEGADIKGTLFLFFWLKSGTEKQPGGDSRGNVTGHYYAIPTLHYFITMYIFLGNSITPQGFVWIYRNKIVYVIYTIVHKDVNMVILLPYCQIVKQIYFTNLLLAWLAGFPVSAFCLSKKQLNQLTV